MIGEGSKPPIRIWALEDAPGELQQIALDGGMAGDWIVLIPAHYANGPEVVGEFFDFDDEWEKTLPDGSVMIVGGNR